MKCVRLLTVVLVLAAGSTTSAEIYRPVSLSLVPYWSTNGPGAESVASVFSLNVIGGTIGSVRGVELGGVFNIDRENVYGYQAAGVFSIVGWRFRGVQQSGVFNIVGSKFWGLQQAGVFNVVGDEFAGVQQAGVVNVVGKEFRGAQMAGVANVVGGAFTGVQLAGVVNAAGVQTRGLQMAGVTNIAEEFSGAQVGLVNIAGRGSGLQLGLVNIADEMDVPIGLVSIVGNGMFHADIWATEFAPVNVGIKTGSKIVYNVFMVGWKPGGDSSRLYGGIGLGGHIPLNRFFVDVDVLSQGVFSGPDWFPEGGSDLLSSLRVTAGWQVADFLSFTAGPTASVWVSDREDGSAVPYYDFPLFQSHETENVRIWPGFTFGLQLF